MRMRVQHLNLRLNRLRLRRNQKKRQSLSLNYLRRNAKRSVENPNVVALVTRSKQNETGEIKNNNIL
jgi:hypothetical protein